MSKESSREHAERILSYGNYRAYSLMKMANQYGCWGHVDWEYIKEKLEDISIKDMKKEEKKSKKKGKK